MEAMMQPEKEKPGLFARYLPIFHWLPHYNKAWLTGDVVAGLSVWALMVPQCLGFAAICGVPVQYGLYAAASTLVSGGVSAGSEKFSANVEADAKRTAKEIAKRLGEFFVGQGWILASAVK
jgi:MFS superfamily sulfate permease-like transporter